VTDRAPAEDPPDVETVRGLCEESHRTFEYQVRRIGEIDSKAIEILKANLLVIGVLVTALSIAVQAGIDVAGIANGFTVAGAAVLLVSTALAGVTYTSSNIRGGIGKPAIDRTLREEYTEREFYAVLARSYGEWIEYNSEVTAVNDLLVTLTVVLVVDAFVLLAAGLAVGFLALSPPATAVSFLVLSTVLVIGSWLVLGMDHINEARS